MARVAKSKKDSIARTKKSAVSAPVKGNKPALKTLEEPRMTKVSVTVDRGLLAFVDNYLRNHPQQSRSGVFDDALEMWVQRAQEAADIACYADDGGEQQEALDWKSVQAESAGRIWS